MSDQLHIEDLCVWTHIGITEEERRAEQRVLVSIDLNADLRKIAKKDDLAHGINYSDVVECIRMIAETERKTIERFAEDIANVIRKKFSAKKIHVTVKKFAIPGAAYAEVSIERD